MIHEQSLHQLPGTHVVNSKCWSIFTKWTWIP